MEKKNNVNKINIVNQVFCQKFFMSNPLPYNKYKQFNTKFD